MALLIHQCLLTQSLRAAQAVVGTVMSFFGDQQPPRLQKYSVPELISG